MKNPIEEIKETYFTIIRILSEINHKNSTLIATNKTDPTSLAKSVWQDIYISTKDNPTACLYNVVEIFIFKFLSDLGVLSRDTSFEYLHKMYKDGYTNKEVLNHYAIKSRKKIKELFKEGSDGTTIINGTIFVNKDGSPVHSQATLFKDAIEKYAKFGDLKNINKEFKTRLFETFLKQSNDKSKLGQFFTPRKVVRSIVEMSDINNAKFICDPFCGVGGFVLEPFEASSALKMKFFPKNGKINSTVKLAGYDSGREDNDEQRRTIILAKANMLIYLSDIVEKYPTLNEQFSELINNTFHFLSNSNLGTLGKIYNSEEEKPDLILTNPPFVTSGMSTMRRQIKEEGLSDDYINSGKGVEGLCLKWIIKNLKKEGKAFVILPEAIFSLPSNKLLRKYLREQCFINCIISLPRKTFFNTPQKTCILGITKKADQEEVQEHPLMIYLTSSIGETLDVDRFEIENNDLDKAKNLFNQFKGNPSFFKTDDPRCKIVSISSIDTGEFWNIERLWSKEERQNLGIEEKDEAVSVRDFKSNIRNAILKLKQIEDSLEFLTEEKKTNFKEIRLLSDDIKDGIFELKKGNANYTKKYVNNNKGSFPVYSSKTKDNGVLGYINSFDYDLECIQMTTNGANAGTLFYRNRHKFSINGDAKLLIKTDHDIDHEYIYYALKKVFSDEGFSWENKVSDSKLKNLSVKIPVKSNGSYDLKKQQELAASYKKIDEIKNQFTRELEIIKKLEINI